MVAAIIIGKYANHLPLDKQSRCYKDNGVKLETNTLANWMMLASELHFSIIYDELHTILSLGGGGMNKVNLPNGRLERFHNPKFPEQYIEMLPGVLKQKEELFALLGTAR